MRQLLRKRANRWREHAFVVEGAELVATALDADAPVEALFVAAEGESDPAVRALGERALEAGARVFGLRPGVMARVADTVTPQPVLAVVGFEPSPLEVLEGASLVVVCVDVRDPGNAGTVIRTVDAAGADGVVCCEGTVDPYNPKTVRASAGSVLHVPVVVGGDATEVARRLTTWGLAAVGTAAHRGSDYSAFDWTGRVALFLGNEAAGLPGSVEEALDSTVTIPMSGRAESLNVSMAAAVVCFEAQRQRRGGASPEPSDGLEGRRMPGMPLDRGSSARTGEGGS